MVFVEIRECGRYEPMQITCTQIGKRLADIRIRKMNEAIAAEDRIRRRKRVTEQIEFPKAYSTIERREQASVTRYNLADDIGSNIPVEMAIGPVHLTKVATRQVEECSYLKCFKKNRKIRAQVRGIFVFGTKSRPRSLGSPQVRFPNFGEEYFRSQPREVTRPLYKTTMGQHRRPRSHHFP